MSKRPRKLLDQVAPIVSCMPHQEFLGHKDVKTHAICTHVLNRGPGAVRSSLDSHRA